MPDTRVKLIIQRIKILSALKIIPVISLIVGLCVFVGYAVSNTGLFKYGLSLASYGTMLSAIAFAVTSIFLLCVVVGFNIASRFTGGLEITLRQQKGNKEMQPERPNYIQVNIGQTELERIYQRLDELQAQYYYGVQTQQNEQSAQTKQSVEEFVKQQREARQKQIDKLNQPADPELQKQFNDRKKRVNRFDKIED